MKRNRVAGILPISLNDYPSEISTVIFFQGCNLFCSYCHNKDLIPIKEGNYNLEYVLDFIRKRKNFITAVVFSGGEPLLHLDVLPEFTKEIKDINPRLKIKIDTNGILIKELDKLIEKGEIFVDKIAIDIKGTEEIYKKFLVNNVNLDIDEIFYFIRKYKDKVILRTTLINELIEKKDEFIKFLSQKIPEEIDYYIQLERINLYKNKIEVKNLENDQFYIREIKEKIEETIKNINYLIKNKRINLYYECEKIC